MRRGVTSVAVILVAAAMAACGSDDDDGDAKGGPTEEPTSSAAGETCAESFNDQAPVDFPRLIRLSHADGAAILTGTFIGDGFAAQVYDEAVAGDGVEATVEPGSCVVTESGELGTLYIFAVGTDGAWHRFLESDPEVPLSTDPAAQLEGVVEVTLDEGQTSDTPDLVPTGS
jgi:hypothetical protein